MKKRLLLTTTILLLANMAFAQKENNVWAFSDHLGLDFNSGTPTFIQTSIATTGGSASVCDENGQLLFYTQGDTLWSRNNQIMPNGAALIAPYTSNTNAQSSQGQLIMPVINDPNKYYVFSMQTTQDYTFGVDPMACHLFYSVVDMSLNNGMGDVVSGQKGIVIDSLLTAEKMIAVQGDSCSMWLLVHRIDDAIFKAYKISNTGINFTPVISATGSMTGPAYALGKMKVSPNGRKLVTADLLLGQYGCEIYDFDPASGIVSNPVVLDSTLPQGISACFSPDNSKLYYFTAAGGNGALYQYDLSLGSTSAIVNSMTLIDTLYASGALEYDAKIGPDNKVYIHMPYSPTGPIADTIGCIANPNAAGLACSYTHAALISPQPITLANGDLPNVFVRPSRDTSVVSSETTLTLTGSATLLAPAGYTNYLWNNGDTTASINITDTGTYWVRAISYCSIGTDTFHVKPFVGVNEIALSNGNLIVYPNPAVNEITIALKGSVQGSGNIRITDVLGKTVITTTIAEAVTHINISELAPGVYQVLYTNDKESATYWHTSIVISR